MPMISNKLYNEAIAYIGYIVFPIGIMSKAGNQMLMKFAD